MYPVGAGLSPRPLPPPCKLPLPRVVRGLGVRLSPTVGIEDARLVLLEYWSLARLASPSLQYWRPSWALPALHQQNRQ